MYLEIGANNQVLGYSSSSNGSNVFTDLPIPSFTDTQILKFSNNAFVVEESPELLAEKQARPLRLLRQKRNQLLTQTDWRMTTDYPYSDQPAWASYRTQLRNLPQTANPTLDEQGNLIVDWPTAPDNV